jgi:hypothetical protein
MVRKTLFCRCCNFMRFVCLMLMLNWSLLERQQTRKNYLKALSVMISICSLHIIHKWVVPSLQCKVSLDQSTAMREIDGLSLIFIVFMFSVHTTNPLK